MTAAGIVQIGQYLTEVKGRLKHGKFQEWIAREFSWGDDSARNFMHVYERFQKPKFSEFGDRRFRPLPDCRAFHP